MDFVDMFHVFVEATDTAHVDGLASVADPSGQWERVAWTENVYRYEFYEEHDAFTFLLLTAPQGWVTDVQKLQSRND